MNVLLRKTDLIIWLSSLFLSIIKYLIAETELICICLSLLSKNSYSFAKIKYNDKQ